MTSVADRLSTILSGALEGAVQRFGLFGAQTSTALLMKQQLQTCCVEVELLGQTLQVCCCRSAAACEYDYLYTAARAGLFVTCRDEAAFWTCMHL